MRQMNFSQSHAWRVFSRCQPRGLAFSLVIGPLLAGCSADVIRLDSPASFSLADNSKAALSRPQVAMNRSSAGAGSLNAQPLAPSEAYIPPSNTGSGTVRMAALPEPVAATPYAQAPVAPKAAKSMAPAAPAAAPSALAAGDKGDAIQIKPGDTLFGLSKRYHASVAELMSVNGLTSPNLKPGQTLYLPVGKSASKKPLTRPTDPASASVPALAAPSSALLVKYDGSYTVKKGDSLYALALQLHVPMTELQQANGITDVRKVRPGSVLKVPAAAIAALPSSTQPSVAAATSETAVKVPPTVVAAETARTIPSTTQPVILNSKKIASIEVTKSDAPASDTATAVMPVEKGGAEKGTQVAAAGEAAGAVLGKLRWPAKGKVIGSFGPRPDGTHNDGVNLSVPVGTEVHAAESGVVAYAGELKGYGNLILVRHDNLWITAYAHNEELLAKRGDKVKRGQIIAKAGKSGQVDQPQVHFELRQGSKAVDPTPFMEKL